MCPSPASVPRPPPQDRIQFAATRIAIIEHTLLDLLLDSEEGKDLARSVDSEVAAVEVLAETLNDLGYAMTLGRTGGLSR